MPRVRSRNAYQHASDFDKGQIVAYRHCGLLHLSVAARVSRDPMTVSIIWNQWVQDVTSRTLSQELGSLTRQQVSARSVRRRMQHHELSWRDVIFSDELSFGFQHQDGCIRVWRYHGDCTLAGCIHHRHTYRSPSEMVWGAIGYTSRSPLVRINGTLNSAHYISGGLRLVSLSLFEPCETLRFSRIMRDCMLPVLYRPFLIRKMMGCCHRLYVHQISRQQKTSCPWLPSDWLVTICESLRLMRCGIVLKQHGHLYLLVHAIQSLFDSMPRHM
ncbi:uncharacterized protein TNCV_2877131 [Trichonephila clavipes]|uniref:Transposase n=1 Tax=Trichonephila clavipes TaxID=2585209 RepID=A0A8X6WDQ7_TRICX|nr:uncharacterized protein TNCV_2877131 [Trichonephila clavipes]